MPNCLAYLISRVNNSVVNAFKDPLGDVVEHFRDVLVCLGRRFYVLEALIKGELHAFVRGDLAPG